MNIDNIIFAFFKLFLVKNFIKLLIMILLFECIIKINKQIIKNIINNINEVHIVISAIIV